jgi:integrase
MARKIKSTALESRSARDRLKPRGKPYWVVVEPGLHLGYRRPAGVAGRPRVSGKWVERRYVGAQAYKVETVATADDFSDPDGHAVIDYWQAVDLVRRRNAERAAAAAGKGPYTVADAIERYLEAIEAEGKAPKDTRSRAMAMIVPALGSFEVAKLDTETINAWIKNLVQAPPRVRTAKGQPQQHRAAATDEEGIRRRRATVNRVVAILKAALNNAHRNGRVPTDTAWRRVKLFKNAVAARLRYITVAEAQRLLNVCEPEFRNLVRAALLTGCRYGELCRLVVADFNPDAGTLAILRSKSGKSRHVVLTEEGAAFFAAMCVGRAGDAVLLPKRNGKSWGPSHQIPLMVQACARAKITPAVTFHGLRHTFASLTVMAGAPLVVVAEALGHADVKMVVKHYSHLSKTYVADEIRRAAPRFGFEADPKVKRLGAPS